MVFGGNDAEPDFFHRQAFLLARPRLILCFQFPYNVAIGCARNHDDFPGQVCFVYNPNTRFAMTFFCTSVVPLAIVTSPPKVRIGRTSMPGRSRSNIRKVMPA